jgi:hypothetical protein
MNDKREQFSTTFPPKVVNILRKHALIDERITMSEMIERYQNAYLKMLEHDKSVKKVERQREKELAEKGRIKCPYCDQWIYRK